jgi:hypothetical protein
MAKDVIGAEAILNRAKPLAHQQAAEIQRFQRSASWVSKPADVLAPRFGRWTRSECGTHVPLFSQV